MHQKIKDYRVFSISMAVFVSIIFYDVIGWAMDIYTPDINTGAALYVTGIVTAIVGLFQFVFKFAANKEDSNPTKPKE